MKAITRVSAYMNDRIAIFNQIDTTAMTKKDISMTSKDATVVND